MPDARPPLTEDSTPDALSASLDGLGHALASREPGAPPAALSAALARRRRARMLTRTIGLSAAAAILLAALALALVRPHPAPVPVPPIAHNTQPPTTPTLAALRALNRDATPETLRFPTTHVSHPAPGAPSTAPVNPAAATTLSPRDARNPDALARALGPARE